MEDLEVGGKIIFKLCLTFDVLRNIKLKYP
jgi:hypothetical protein